MNVSILLIAILVSIASSIVGVFLVLRKMSMMTDAISHTVLLGIVIGYAITFNLNSPLLIILAAVMGVVTTYLIELLIKSKRTSEDAATGVIFPLLFSIAVIVISIKFRNVHLDVDAVLLGNLEFAIFDQFIIAGKSIGPKSLYVMLAILLINFLFLLIFYKELKIVSFDPALAAVLGIFPTVIHYGLMFLVSLTSVAAFNAVGSILVIALMIGPPITALLLTDKLSFTVILSIVIGILNSIIGYFIAIYYDVVISGSIAATTLVVFLLVFLFNPKSGMLFTIIKRNKQKRDFTLLAMLIHLNNHIDEIKNLKITDPIAQEMLAIKADHKYYIKYALNKGFVIIDNDYIDITDKGIELINNQNML